MLAVIGASGFIGKRLVLELLNRGYKVNAFCRDTSSLKHINGNIVLTIIPHISASLDWENYLTDDIEGIFYCASLIESNKRENKLTLKKSFFDVNTFGMASLAKVAAKKGVKKFIYLSSIKVNGENTDIGVCFDENTIEKPEGFYAESKFQGEKELQKISKKYNLSYTILRPTIVFGPGAKGSFKTLFKILSFGIPLPFKDINNVRSMIGISNLIDILVLCIEDERATNKKFVVSDGSDFSTSDLIINIAKNAHLKPKLFRLPERYIMFFLKFLNKEEYCKKLFESLRVDNSLLVKTLDWKPSIKTQSEIKQMVLYFANDDKDD